MRCCRVIKIQVLLIGVLILAAPIAASSGPARYGTWLKPVVTPFLDGPATLEFGVNVRDRFDTMIVKVITTGKIDYRGPETWVIRNDSSKQFVFNPEIIIPLNDTCGIEFEIYVRNGLRNSSRLHFVTTGDTLEISQYWPTPKIERKWPIYINADGDTLDTDSVHAHWFDKSNPEESYEVKSSGYRIKYPPTEEEIRDSLERNPLTTHHRQFIMVDSVMLVRDKGEHEFRPAHGGTIESIGAASTERSRLDTADIIMDLRMPDDYEELKRLVNDLLPMERTGFYRTSVTREKAGQIQDMGINISIYPNYPDQPKRKTRRETNINTPASDQRKEDTNPDKGTDDYQDLFIYDFEDANISDTWYTIDYNNDDGYDYWGIIDDTLGRVAYGGYYAAWCASRGDCPAGIRYDNNMNAFMYSKSPINIQGYTELELSCEAWWCTEYNYDYFIVAFSFDCNYWYYILEESGDCNDDELSSYSDLIYQGNYVYIGFIFTSDDIVHDFEGAYVDDVELWGYYPMPELTPYADIGWSGSIVASSEPGTNTSSEIYADQPAYIDVGAINQGDFYGVASPYAIALFVDNNWVHNFYVTDSTSYGDVRVFEDYPITLPEGFHDIKIVVDYYDQVEEIYEDNNTYEYRFEWVIPEITVRGHAQYRDIGQGGIIKDARNIYVELWDKNLTHNHTLLGSSWAHEDGSFEFYNVVNKDLLEGGFLDIYVRLYSINAAAIAYAGLYPGIDTISFTSMVYPDVPPPEYDFYEIIVSSDSSGGFYAIDKILDGYHTWLQHAPAPTQPVSVIFQQTARTRYSMNGDCIKINNSDNPDLMAPDDFDGDIILHEYGHRFAFVNGFMDSITAPEHTWCGYTTQEDAGAEAFAEYWAAYVTDDPILHNTWDNFGKYYIANTENGEYGENGNVDYCNSNGVRCIGSVAGILWDIYDNVDDDYDGDGKGDVFDGGPDAMLNVLTEYDPLHINTFWDYWINNGYNHNHEMWAIWYEHGDILKDVVPPTGTISINNGDAYTASLIVDITLDFTDTLSGMIPPLAEMCFRNGIGNPWSVSEPYNTVKSNWDLSLDGGNTEYGPKQVIASVCDAAGFTTQVSATIGYGACLPGDANGDGVVDVGDIRYLIVYIFQSGAPPTPYPVCSGDFDGDCFANVGDVVSIINYVFKGGSPPIDCDTWISNCGLPIRK